MKKLIFLSVLLYGVFLASGCELLQLEDFTISDPVISSPIPGRAVEFIQANFPNHAVRWSQEDDLCDDTRVLEVDLEDGTGPDIDLYFTLDGTFLFSATDISVSDLPEAVLTTITTEFSAYQIDDREVDRLDFPDGSIQYEVEIIDANGEDHDLVLAPDGTVICWEDNFPDDDEEGDDTVTVPDSIRSQIMMDYPGYHISNAEREDLCDDEYFFKIELEDGNGPDVDLYFSLNWVFTFTATDLNVADLPAAVTDALAINYPAYSIDPEKVERLDYPDGTLNYSLELETANGSDLDVIYDAAGNLVCEDAERNDDDDDDTVTVPDSIRSQIMTGYPGYHISSAEREDLCDDEYFFKIELEDGNGPDVDLYFSLNWVFTFTATDLNVADLPAAVTDALAINYPAYSIDPEKVERLDYPDGTLNYSLELETANGNDLDVIYDAAGNLVCEDADRNDDDNSDDDNNNSSSLPDSVRAFIASQYPGYRIDHLEREDLCDDDYYFKVELEDGNGPDLELYFTLSWEFYLEAEEISPRDVPTSVTSVLEADYPGAIIEEAERQTYADGTTAYYLEIETASGRNEKITYAADGTLVCRED